MTTRKEVDNSPAVVAGAEQAEPGLDVSTADIDVGQEAAAGEWEPTKRNRHLRKVCEDLVALEKVRSAGAETQNGHGGNLGNVRRQERKAGKNLMKACGGCGLREICEVVDDLRAWHKAHPHSSATINQPGAESRLQLLRRIKVDPRAPCILPQ